jgi:hypothetical protein
MLGTHCRLGSPAEGEVYVATIDVGGQDEAATEGAGLASPGRDYTICTIIRVKRDPQVEIGPVYEAVDVFVDHGSRHFQDAPGRPSLFNRLLAYLKHWNAAAVICDMTGVGQGLTDALQEAYARNVVGFDFARNYGKARLGSDFLALVETGRFRYFWDNHDVEGFDAWWFLTQAEYCAYELTEGIPIERGLRWGVNPSAKAVFSDGRSELIHDDRLLSAALVAEADRQVRDGKLFLTTGDSAVIELEGLDDAGAWA